MNIFSDGTMIPNSYYQGSCGTIKDLHTKLLQILKGSNQEPSKLMSILNFGESLKYLEVRILSPVMEKFDNNYHNLIDIFSPILDNFNQIERIKLEYSDVSNGEEQFDIFKSSAAIFLLNTLHIAKLSAHDPL